MRVRLETLCGCSKEVDVKEPLPREFNLSMSMPIDVIDVRPIWEPHFRIRRFRLVNVTPDPTAIYQEIWED
jgi:hypothetical protein